MECVQDSSSATSTSEDTGVGFDPLPVVEIMERENLFSTDPRSKMYQAYKGQLKLAVYMNYGLLTVHVIQARHLTNKCKPTCDAYVKVALIPDVSKRTQCTTDIVHDTNSPMFDEKFSFELWEEDMRKRLLISMWHKIPGRDYSEFLGCMSFGVRHIQSEKRSIQGWYYLLTDEVGRRKHLQAMTRPHCLKEKANMANSAIPQVNQDVLWMDPHVLVLRKSRAGYGFTVTGSCPVTVARVEADSTAAEAGLQKGDCIIRVDGLNVSRSTSDSVARIIKHTEKRMVLEIQRAQSVETTTPTPTTTPVTPSPWQPTMSSTPIGQQNYDIITRQQYSWPSGAGEIRYMSPEIVVDGPPSTTSSGPPSSHSSGYPGSIEIYQSAIVSQTGLEVWIDDPWTATRSTGTLSRPKKKVTFKDFG